MLLVGVADDEHRALAPVVELLGVRWPPVTKASLIRSYWVRLVSGTHPRARGESGRASSETHLFVALQQLDGQQSSRSSKSRGCVGGQARGLEACRPRPPAATHSLRPSPPSHRAASPPSGFLALLIASAPSWAQSAWDPVPSSLGDDFL